MNTKSSPFTERQGFANQGLAHQSFATQDILWAIGVWSVILSLSPVIVVYMMMVA